MENGWVYVISCVTTSVVCQVNACTLLKYCSNTARINNNKKVCWCVKTDYPDEVNSPLLCSSSDWIRVGHARSECHIMTPSAWFPYPNELGLNSVLSSSLNPSLGSTTELSDYFCLVCVSPQKQPHPAGTVVIRWPRLLSPTLHMCCRYTVTRSFGVSVLLSGLLLLPLHASVCPCYLILITSSNVTAA